MKAALTALALLTTTTIAAAEWPVTDADRHALQQMRAFAASGRDAGFLQDPGFYGFGPIRVVENGDTWDTSVIMFLYQPAAAPPEARGYIATTMWFTRSLTRPGLEMIAYVPFDVKLQCDHTKHPYCPVDWIIISQPGPAGSGSFWCSFLGVGASMPASVCP
jgi:hypothetical protein